MRLKKILLYRSKASGLLYWTLKASNGRIIGASTEGYKEKRHMLANLHEVLNIETRSNDGFAYRLVPVPTYGPIDYSVPSEAKYGPWARVEDLT